MFVHIDVISVNTETHDYIMNKRVEHYMFMKDSLEVMRKIDESTPKPVVHALMYLMTEDVLLFDQKQQVTYCLKSCIFLHKFIVCLFMSTLQFQHLTL